MSVVLNWRRYFLRLTVAVRRMATVRTSVPVVVVLGSTATGKSKLAVDLAKKFDGEVISADSMQVYNGLDILTNKVTEEEMKGVKHHMIGMVDRNQKFDVINFRDRALPIVEEIIARGKVPFIVGGTNYYIESILWKVLLGSKNDSGEEGESSSDSRKRKVGEIRGDGSSRQKEFVDHPILRFMEESEGLFKDTDVSNLTNQELYTALHIVDPERTTKLHPNDRRKILRSLQVRFQSGRKHSELIAEQCAPLAHENSKGRNTSVSGVCLGKDSESVENNKGFNSLTTSLGGPLRFDSSFCLWLKVDKQILNNRIDTRVEEMIGRGLKKELDDYMDDLIASNSDLNYEEGVLQSIGFKEFHTYLQVDPSERHSESADKLFLEGLARLKVVTKQYAKKQLKWINQRFLRPSRRQVPPVYWLDGSLTDSTNWDKNVTAVAESIVGAYLEEKLDLPLLKEHLEPCENDNPDSDLIARTCVTCDNRVFIGKDQWEVHIKSARHRRMLKRKDKPKYEPVVVNADLNCSESKCVDANHQAMTSS